MNTMQINNQNVLFQVILTEDGQVVANYKKPENLGIEQEKRLNEIAFEIFKEMFVTAALTTSCNQIDLKTAL